MATSPLIRLFLILLSLRHRHHGTRRAKPTRPSGDKNGVEGVLTGRPSGLYHQRGDT